MLCAEQPSDTWICASGNEDNRRSVELVERLHELKVVTLICQRVSVTCAITNSDNSVCAMYTPCVWVLQTASENLQQLLINGDLDHLQYVWTRLTDRDTVACMRDKVLSCLKSMTRLDQ